MIFQDYSPTEPTPILEVLRDAGALHFNTVLEGLNCVGKSTIAEIIAKERGARLLTLTRRHQVPPYIREQFDHFTLGQYRLMIELARSMDVVIDRCHPSAYVFGELLWEQVSWCEDNWPENLLGLYIYADDDVVKQRMKDKGESDDLFDLFLKHKARYEWVIENSKVSFIKINTSLTTV